MSSFDASLSISRARHFLCSTIRTVHVGVISNGMCDEFSRPIRQFAARAKQIFWWILIFELHFTQLKSEVVLSSNKQTHTMRAEQRSIDLCGAAMDHPPPQPPTQMTQLAGFNEDTWMREETVLLKKHLITWMWDMMVEKNSGSFYYSN